MVHVDAPAVVSVLFAQGTSMHWAVLPAFCAFLGLQLYLYLSHRRAIGRQSKPLRGLWQQGCMPEPTLVQGNGSHDWLSWVVTRFHNGALHDGLFSRENVLEQLDNWLEGNGSYLLLQRMGIMAPLFGLLITVTGFFFLEPATAGNGDLKQILHTLTPLVLGVGTGASLAIINQLLLHLAGKRTDAVRLVAIDWFDDYVWPLVRTKPEAAANDAAEALKSMADTIRGSVEQYHAATSAIGQTCQSLQGAGAALVDTVERLREDTAVIPDEMKSLRSTAASVIRSLGEIVPAVEQVTSELAESVVAFKSVVQEQFGQAADRHLKSAELLAGSVDQIRGSAEGLTKSCGTFGQIVDAQATASQEWSHSLREDVLPALRSFQQAGVQLIGAVRDLGPTQRAFHEAADSMQGSASGLAAFVRDGVEPATHRLAELDQVLTRMRETTEAVRQMTQLRQEFAGLATSLSQAAAAAEAIRSLPQEIRTVLQTVAPNHNGDAGPRRPFFLRLLGGFGSRGRSNHNGRP